MKVAAGLFFLTLAFAEVLLACSPNGTINYDSTGLMLRSCNNGVWTDMGNGSTATASSCIAGTFTYNTGATSFQFCNGSGWISMKGDTGATGCGATGNLIYDSTAHRFKFYDGTACYYAGAVTTGGDPCGTVGIGQACVGTTAVFVGNYGGYRYMTTPGGCTATSTSNPTCASSDVSMYYSLTDLAAGTATSTTDGRTYTPIIANADAASTSTVSATQSAMKYCNELVYGGYGSGTAKWFIPAQDEITTLFYNNAASIPNLNTTATGYYLTSTQSATTSTQSYYVSMNTGVATAFAYRTGGKRYARCVFKYAY